MKQLEMSELSLLFFFSSDRYLNIENGWKLKETTSQKVEHRYSNLGQLKYCQ